MATISCMGGSERWVGRRGSDWQSLPQHVTKFRPMRYEEASRKVSSLKLQYFGHLMRRVDSLENTLMLGGIVGRRRRGSDGWMASLIRWTWVWVNSGSCWWTGRPGVLQFMGSQRVGTVLIGSEIKTLISQYHQNLLHHAPAKFLFFLFFLFNFFFKRKRATPQDKSYNVLR